MLKRTTAKSKKVAGGIADKIRPVQDLGLTLAALIYGRAGTGKTTLAATFPGPLLHLDIREKGTDSVSDIEGLDTVQVETWEEFEQVYWYLLDNPTLYSTVIVDAVTQLQDLAVEQAMADDGKEVGKALVTQRQWGSAAGKLKTWIVNYRDLVDQGIHVVFLAHDKTSEGEEGLDGELSPSIGPRVMPSVASILTACVKLIGNTFIQESKSPDKTKRDIKYCMRIGPHAYYETKIRQPKNSFTPDIIVDPNYEKLVAIMRGEYRPAEPKPAVKSTLTKRRGN